MPDSLLAITLLVAVLVMVVWRPFGLSIGWTAAAGGALAVALGIVTLPQVRTVLDLTWDATLTFVAVVIVSTVLDAIGFFEWAALHMARLARGDGQRLFVYTLLLGALVSALFTNDGAALILTPIVYEQVKALRLREREVLAFVMAGGFIADATSLPLVVSNIVNILSADFFHIGFASYALRMLPVDLAALAASLFFLLLVFRKDIPRSVPGQTEREPRDAIRDPRLFRASFVVLALLLLGYPLTEVLGLPVSLIAGAAALTLMALARRSPAVRVVQLVREAPWKVIVFSVGMYIVVFGLKNAGLTALLARSLRAVGSMGMLEGVLYTGYLSAGVSSLMNNLPTVMVNALAIQGAHLHGSARLALALANVVGSDIGAKITPIGSLATLLWMHALERRGVRIGWGYFIRTGVALTLPVLLVTLVALWAVTAL